SERRAFRLASSSALALSTTSKSLSFCSIRCSRVFRLCGMRERILSFSRFSVSDTLTVRSKGSSPECTRLSVSTTWRRTPSHSRTLRRNRLRHLDLLGQRDFLVTPQQWDGPHLGQVHPDGVVDAPAVLVVDEGGQLEFGAQLLVEVGLVGDAPLALLGLGLVDQLDPLFFQEDEELIELLGVDGVIGQVIVDLPVGQVALFLALLEQGFQAVIDLLHQTLPHPS